MILADIGNTRVHIYDNGRVIHLSHIEAIERYGDRAVKYISVKSQLKPKLSSLKKWQDISNKIELKGSYPTMGVDRKAISLSHRSGIFISAGTAITVDIVEDGVYCGGFILLGLRAYINAYATISPALKSRLNQDVSLDTLPKTTQDAISYAIIASIKSIIDKHKGNRQLYITGGDGKFISSLFDNSIYDERLIFLGMRNSI